MSQVVLRCAPLGRDVALPFWPEEMTHTPSGWNVSSLERPRDVSYDRPSTLSTEERSMGFTVRNADYRQSIAPLLADLALIMSRKAPVQLILGDRDTGLWRIDPGSQITEVQWADDGTPSVADVSLTLKRASSAVVNVGPVKVRGGGKGFAGRK